MTRRLLARTARTALAALVLSVFAACAATPTPTQPPTSSPSSKPTPSATPSATPSPEPAAAAVVVSAEHFQVVDADGGVLASYDYFQPTAEVVAGLTGYLGEPVDTEFEGHNDAPRATYHDWGGLRLVDTAMPASPPTISEHWVRITSTDANGLALRAFDGSTVGGSIANVEGEISDYTNPNDGIAYRTVRIGIVPIETTPDGFEQNFAVAVHGEVAEDRILFIIAPSPNFGA
ncbi:hypothetical protein [Agromyces soli]|uniref:Uncharacterized protein n=1 Tax=Agromyces soli TaxID=659012 RepID=A0ABY4AW42_9MICO|nr:hypothetical protein [Agromyces soli]UOE27407.1 hypothetical protein MTP13_06395 [Agromyces soli]